MELDDSCMNPPFSARTRLPPPVTALAEAGRRCNGDTMTAREFGGRPSVTRLRELIAGIAIDYPSDMDGCKSGGDFKELVEQQLGCDLKGRGADVQAFIKKLYAKRDKCYLELMALKRAAQEAPEAADRSTSSRRYQDCKPRPQILLLTAMCIKILIKFLSINNLCP